MDLAVLLLVLAQASLSLSGTWKLDPAGSRIENEVGWPGLIGAGAPDRIHVTHAANGTLVIESEINEGHARIYRPGGETATPVAQTGRITMTSRWEGRTFVAEGKLMLPSGESSTSRETLTLSENGLTLTVEISTTAPQNSRASTLAFTRTEGVDPCEKWPTPCKPAGK